MRVVTRCGEIAHAVEVGLGLGAAAIALVDELCADTGRTNGQVRIVAAAGCDGRCQQSALQKQAALHGLGAVTSSRVNDLVTEHGGELRLGVELDQQPAIHRDLSAG